MKSVAPQSRAATRLSELCLSFDHCRSKERVLFLPTKLERAAEDRACRSAHVAEEAEEERCWVCLEGKEDGKT